MAKFENREAYEQWKGHQAQAPVSPQNQVMSLPPRQPKEFKVEVITEGALGTLFFGTSKLSVRKMTDVLNRYGRQGWDVAFMLVEQKRFLLL